MQMAEYYHSSSLSSSLASAAAASSNNYQQSARRDLTLIVFDTETNGLPRRQEGFIPNVLQIAWAVYAYNSESQKFTLDGEESYFLHQKFSEDSDENLTQNSLQQWDTEAEQIHKISKETLRKYGVQPSAAILAFNKALSSCQLVVAHNLFFDFTIVENEAKKFNVYLEWPIFQFCTMLSTAELCRLLPRKYISQHWNSQKQCKWRWPKLIELYGHLFGASEMENVQNKLHNALEDVKCTARCFISLAENRKTHYLNIVPLDYWVQCLDVITSPPTSQEMLICV